MQDMFEWNEPTIQPELRKGRLTSRPLLFIVAGRVYSGNYHDNGYFYNKNYPNEDKLFLAVSPLAKETGCGWSPKVNPLWRNGPT